MSWETIQPRTGARAKRTGVAVSWRKVSSLRLCAVVTISKDTVAELGLAAPQAGKPKQRLLAQRDRASNRLRLSISEAPEAWSPSWKDGCASLAIPMDGVTLATHQPATGCLHKIEDGALIVDLPGWARGAPPAPRHAIPLVEPAREPEPPKKPHRTSAASMHTPKQRDADPNDPLASLPADDLTEAREMMRGGKVGAKALAEYFGWDQDLAVKIAAALRDELTLPGRAA
jgi:hypothetical protein